MTAHTDFPTDRDGKPLAWPDPKQPEWYVDAWNGIYDSRESALAETHYWVALEAERTLSYGERLVPEDEHERRRARNTTATDIGTPTDYP